MGNSIGGLFTLTFLVFVASSPHELALEIVNVALVVQQILLLVAFDLDSAESLLGQVLGVVHVDDVFVLLLFAFAFASDDDFLTVSGCVLLQSDQLALRQVVNVNVAVRLGVDDLLSVLMFEIGELVDLILYECVLTGRLHHELRVVVKGQVEVTLVFELHAALLLH